MVAQRADVDGALLAMHTFTASNTHPRMTGGASNM
jgi:hypothetical protein